MTGLLPHAEELGIRPADGPVVEPARAGLRVAHRFAREATSQPCARGLSIVDITAGEWHATEPGDLDRPVCDHCARRDDPDGFAMVAAFRRMARRAA